MDKHVHQPIKIGEMTQQLLMATTRGRASHCETPHSYYSENQGYISSLKIFIYQRTRDGKFDGLWFATMTLTLNCGISGG